MNGTVVMKFWRTAVLGAMLTGMSVAPVAVHSAGGRSAARQLEEAFTEVAEKTFPAVVVIRTRRTLRTAVPGAGQGDPFGLPFPLPPQFEQFRQRRGNPAPPSVQGGGSGFIVRGDGHILTNHHVVADHDEVTVILNDGREFAGKVIGTDRKTDLAVIKIEVEGELPQLEFADSDQVRVGQWAIAIGAPFNLDYTMTVGVVSQKGRAVGINVYENYIQTDASINPGNSGGPLLDLDGKVVGVNDFIVSGGGVTPGNIGLGFAIPSNMAREVMEQLIRHGEVVRPWVGISMQNLTPELKRQFQVETGVLVGEVFTGDPADQAGIQPGDVIIRLDGQAVREPKDVQFGILKHQPGEKVRFTVWRDGQEREFEVVASRQSAEEMTGEPLRPELPAGGRLEDFGLRVEAERERVVIAAVEPDSIAQRRGLRAGDVVHEINRQKVASMADAERAAAGAGGQLLLYVSDGRVKRFVVLERLRE